MKNLYELEQLINDELSRYTVDCDGDPDDQDFTARMARRIHEQHILPLEKALADEKVKAAIHQLERAMKAAALAEPTGHDGSDCSPTCSLPPIAPGKNHPWTAAEILRNEG